MVSLNMFKKILLWNKVVDIHMKVTEEFLHLQKFPFLYFYI